MALKVATVPAASRPFLISFSGIDGAGKTTQIERLSSFLEEQGLRVLRLNFWEHVAIWPNMRAGVGYRAMDLRSDSRNHSFSPRNNKHVRNWYLTAARSGFYLLDIGRLQRLLAQSETRRHDVLIFDRYIYDQIANVYSQSMAARAYARFLLSLAPVPDLAFVVDASPAEAFARKPEYPLEFVYRNRRSFLQLREVHPELIIIAPGGVDEVAHEIRTRVIDSKSLETTSPRADTEAPTATAVLHPQTFRTIGEEPTAKI